MANSPVLLTKTPFPATIIPETYDCPEISTTSVNLPPDPLIQSQPIAAGLAGNLASMTGAAKTMLVGSTLATIGAAVAATGVGVVVGAIIAAVGALIGLAGKLFGNKWHLSSKVRWLIQWFEFYVMGDPTATSSNHVEEINAQEAMNWFTAVLGVPVYDVLRVHALKGTNPDNGEKIQPLQSYHTRAINYLSFWDAKDVTYNNAYAAAQIADVLIENKKAGSWANLPFAKYWFERITVAELGENQKQDNLINATDTNEGCSANPSIAQQQAILKALGNEQEIGEKNKTIIIIAAAVVLIAAFIFIFRKRLF